MKQTTLSLQLEVKPESASQLNALVETLKADNDKPFAGAADNFASIKQNIPVLHFMSMTVFENQNFDPIFIFEANFDGDIGPFWSQVEGVMGGDIREMIRCCKVPLDKDSELYRAVTEKSSPIAATHYLKARAQAPSVYHHGNRGLSRDNIVNEAELFRAIRAELDADTPASTTSYREMKPHEFRDKLYHKLEHNFKWLEGQKPPRITTKDRVFDWGRLVAFVMIIYTIFVSPGILLAALVSVQAYLVGFAIAAVVMFLLLSRLSKKSQTPTISADVDPKSFLNSRAVIGVVAVFIIYALICLGFFCLLNLIGFNVGSETKWAWAVFGTALLGQLAVFIVGAILVLWIRTIEERDASQDAPHLVPEMLDQMAHREDWITQNHMGSVVTLRPGVLRTLIVKAGHRGLGLYLRATATHGRLGSMRTVHFGHWTFLNNSSQLLFLSNYDQSWGSYLDDFIEKAAVGLTLAWGCGIGFPATRFLVLDGARHGRKFKNWALASRSVSRFWYSAYPELSVDQIERNHAIANGLRRHGDGNSNIEEWMRLL